MMSNISFFIPAYNCAKTLGESVISILETNFQDGDELIIVNDCATDNTAEVLEELKNCYPIIHVINHKRNKGGAAARNTAVENAKNEFLFCLDSDNVLERNSIRPLKDYLLIQEADVASFQHQHFFSTDKMNPLYIWSLPAGKFDNSVYFRGGNMPGQHGNYLFTKSSWVKAKGYSEGSGALDTSTFGLRQAISGAKKVVLEGTYYYHRLEDNSYWMKDAESNIWSVSMKVSYALFPFYDRIDEDFLNYMLGEGKYYWYYNLKKKPIKLVQEGSSKEVFYANLHKKTHDFIYPKATIWQRIVNRMKSIIST
jgi:glycosyltransferase involved in cell wall biosynthesis